MVKLPTLNTIASTGGRAVIELPPPDRYLSVRFEWEAMQPDGSVWLFERKPWIGAIDGTYKGPGGDYVYGPAVPWWESDGWELCAKEGDPAFFYAGAGDLFAEADEGWRDSLRRLAGDP